MQNDPATEIEIVGVPKNNFQASLLEIQELFRSETDQNLALVLDKDKVSEASFTFSAVLEELESKEE